MGTLCVLRIRTLSFPVSGFRVAVVILRTDRVFGGLAGEVVADGTDFRNGAHLRFKADLFVPCGGR